MTLAMISSRRFRSMINASDRVTSAAAAVNLWVCGASWSGRFLELSEFITFNSTRPECGSKKAMVLTLYGILMAEPARN